MTEKTNRVPSTTNIEQVADKVDLVLWLITRYQSLRSATTRRAGIVVSADAILLAGTAFLLDRSLLIISATAIGQEIFLLFSIISVILFVTSIAYATHGLVNVWRSSREMFGPGLPKRLFFHPQDTIVEFPDFGAFRTALENSGKNELFLHASADLWTSIRQHNYGYRKLRTAVRLLVVGALPYLISILMVFGRILYEKSN